jgi:hypothetical protein
MQKLKMLPPELKVAFFGQLITVHRHIDLRFANIEFAKSSFDISDLLAQWCLSKDVVKFLMSHIRRATFWSLQSPFLLHFSEAANGIMPLASVS